MSNLVKYETNSLKFPSPKGETTQLLRFEISKGFQYVKGKQGIKV
jgi:hypothetical protein